VRRLFAWIGVGIAVSGGFGASCANDAQSARRAKPADCSNDPNELRIWTLSLSHPDTVTLKNVGECPTDLEGVELLFDDRDDAFPPETLLDCTLRLPRVVLPAGASIRVSELPLPGEIDALAAEVGGCFYPLSFNPDRGGVTYLCDGECNAGSLIDAVAHQGDDIDAIEPGVVVNRYRDPPAMRFGARFSAPLRGASKHNDGLVRYQRMQTAGRFPDYLGSDWGLESRVLFADFEDGIRARNVAATPVPFGIVRGAPTEIVASIETAASFDTSLRMAQLGEDGVSDALSSALDGFSSPRELRYFARASTAQATAGNLALLLRSRPVVELGFAPGGVGASYGEGKRAEIASTPDRWYRIELRDIDWDAGRFDLYVDETRIGRALDLAENEGLVDEVRMYGVTGGSTAYFDAIELWGLPYAMPEPNGAGGANGAIRCSAASGSGG
jgi:hypothetical protein